MEDATTDVMPTVEGRAPAILPSPLERWGLDVGAMDFLARSLTSPEDESSRSHLMRDARDMATELAGPNPSPTVRILAETAAICWAELRRAEISSLSTVERTIAEADYHQRHVDRCHARLMRTLRTLAQVRRLECDAPAVQVNVMQAVNVGGPVSG